jgi:hypothetical protein
MNKRPQASPVYVVVFYMRGNNLLSTVLLPVFSARGCKTCANFARLKQDIP